MPHPIQKEQYGSYLWLKREVGSALGLSRDDGTWNHADHGRVESIVQSGYMQKCFPPPLQDIPPQAQQDSTDSVSAEAEKEQRVRQPYVWSYLKQLTSVETQSGIESYVLPSDFAGPSGDLVISTGEGRLPIISEEQVRQLLASDSQPGSPKYLAIRAKSSDMQGDQQWECIFYPRPDKNLSATFRYTVVPHELSDDNPLPLGGRQHAETILASCLAVAEEREGPIKGNPPGTMAARFMQRLAASIHLDKQTAKATEETTWQDTEGDPAATIQAQIGLQMGFGQNSNVWTETQKQQVKEAFRRGLRRFYVPVPIPGQKRSHSWSFLNPLATINLVPGQWEYDLPEDFGALDSPITYKPGTNVLYPDVTVIGEQQIRRLLQSSVQASGRPTRAATRVKTGIQEGGTRYEIVFWPVPDADYSLEYRYLVAPGDSLSVIHGGSPHLQTILEACLCEADAMQNKRYRKHEERFMERLAASVHYDQALSSPKSLGYNRDRSDGWGRHASEDIMRAGQSQSGVTYNGIQY